VEKGRSAKLSGNALYYAVASFFLFGFLLGLMGFLESTKALKEAANEQETAKAKRVRVLSIVGMSGPVINILLGMALTGEVSTHGVIWNSWLIIIVFTIVSFVIA
jgi:hypothetical protein